MQSEQLTIHLAQVRLKLLETVKEGGIKERVPSALMLRLIHDTLIEYWEEFDRQQSHTKYSPDELGITTQWNQEYKGWEVCAVEPTEEIKAILLYRPDQDACYFDGHMVSLDIAGRLVSIHKDGSPCRIGCPVCPPDKAEVCISNIGASRYCHCSTCGSSTPLYMTWYEAFGAWVIAKTLTMMVAEEEQ